MPRNRLTIYIFSLILVIMPLANGCFASAAPASDNNQPEQKYFSSFAQIEAINPNDKPGDTGRLPRIEFNHKIIALVCDSYHLPLNIRTISFSNGLNKSKNAQTLEFFNLPPPSLF